MSRDSTYTACNFWGFISVIQKDAVFVDHVGNTEGNNIDFVKEKLMKKIIVLILSISLILVFGGCDNETEFSDVSNTSVESSSTKNEFELAIKALDERNYEQAYKLLYEYRNESDVDDMLSRFKIEAKKVIETMYSGEQTTTTYTFDSLGNKLTVITDVNGIITKTENKFDDNGNMIESSYTNENNETSRSTYQYDEFDRITKWVRYNVNNSITEADEYEYNANNDIIKHIHTVVYGTKTTVETIFNENYKPLKITTTVDSDSEPTINENSYDDDGNLIKSITTKGDKVLSAGEFVYKNGNLVKEVINNASSGTETKETEYDSDNNPVKVTFVDTDGRILVDEYRYDEKGTVIWHFHTMNNGHPTIKEYTYDNNGNLLTEKCAYNDKLEYLHEYTYNEDGEILSEIGKNKDGEIAIKYVYTYDENNRLIKKETQEFDKEYIYEYVFDEVGNLIKETVTNENGNQKTTEYSDFAYFYSQDNTN